MLPLAVRNWHSATAKNGNAVLLRSIPSRVESNARALGPEIAAAAHCSVTEVANTSSSGQSFCSRNSMFCITFTALTVVVVIR